MNEVSRYVRSFLAAGIGASVACWAGPAGAGGSENVNLLAHIDNYSFHNDVWGYAAEGVELAIVGTFDGTSFVDVTDTDNPVEVGFFSGPGSTWRDIKTYQTYAYIVNESGSGLQIIDLADPLNPVDLGFYSGAFSTCHNVWIDTGAGVLYAVGTNNGTQILSLAAPASPSQITSFQDYYVHDIYVKDGLAYAAAIYDGLVAIWDVSLLPAITELGAASTPGFFCHNTWTTEDQAYCLTTDEVDGGHIGIFDVSNPNSISFVEEWTNPDEVTSIVHNVTVKEGFAYIAWYTSGLQILDISNPSSPQRVGYYDTNPGANGYDGAWGVYPFTPSGHIYIGDMSSGLYVFEFNPNFGTIEGTVTDAATDLPIEDAVVTVPSESREVSTDAAGYYRITIDPGSYQVFYDAFGYDQESRNVTVTAGVTETEDVPLQPQPTGSLAGVITGMERAPLTGAAVVLLGTPLAVQSGGDGSYAFPAVPVGAYTVEASIFGYAPGAAFVEIEEGIGTDQDLTLIPACFADDLETNQGWTVGAAGDDATTGIWTRVDPNGTGGGGVQPEDDHTASPGVLCFVTGQAPPGSGVGDNDVDGGRTTLLTPVYDLSAATSPVLVYYRWYSNDAGGNPGTDIFEADISSNGGGTWNDLETLGQTRNFWERMEFDIAAYATAQVRIRFIASDEGGGSVVEAAIDDLMIFCDEASGAPDGPSISVTRLLPAAPNPAAGPRELRFQLGRREPVRLEVVDLQGRVVRRLVSGTLEAGAHAYSWDGRNGSGRPVAAGIYLQRLVTAGGPESGKIVVTR